MCNKRMDARLRSNSQVIDYRNDHEGYESWAKWKLHKKSVSLVALT